MMIHKLLFEEKRKSIDDMSEDEFKEYQKEFKKKAIK